MVDSIVNILILYDKNPLMNKNDLVREIRALGYNINARDQGKNTALMHYCTMHRSDINAHSYIAIETMITELHADVNIKNRAKEIPLDLFLSDAPNTVTTSIIKLLVKYTKTSSLIFKKEASSKSIFEKMCYWPRYFDSGILQQAIGDPTIGYVDDREDAALMQLYEIMFDSISNISHVPTLNYLLDRLIKADSNFIIESEDWFDLLLNNAVYFNNKKLIEVLLTYSPDLVEDTNLLPYIKNDEEVQKLFAQNFNGLIRSTIINGVLVNISALNVDDPSINSDQNNMIVMLGRMIIMSYKQNSDIVAINRKLGFQNNIFHMIALMQELNKDQIHEIYNQLPDAACYLKSTNLLAQNPITIALLCGNTEFLSFYRDIDDLSDTKVIDIFGNTPVHIIARVVLPIAKIKEIFNIFELHNVVNTPNKMHYTPLYEVIKSSNVLLLQYLLQQDDSILRTEYHGTPTPWHYYAVAADFTSPSCENLQKIYEILKLNIPDIIDHPDFLGVRPLHLAIENLRIDQLALMLRDTSNHFDFNAVNQYGNTITHTLCFQIVQDMECNESINTPLFIDIVDLLIPHHKNIKANYLIRNIYGETPIDILTKRLGKFSHYLYALIEGDVIDIIQDIITAEDLISVVASQRAQTAVLTMPTSQISERIQDIIHQFSLEIVYGYVNEWGDNVLHDMASMHRMGFGTEPILMHILNILPRDLLPPSLSHANHLGQCLGHIAIQECMWTVLYKLLKFDLNVINQVTTDIKIDSVSIEGNTAFSLVDYAIMLHDAPNLQQLMNLVLFIKQRNSQSSDLIIKTNFIDSITTSCKELQNAFDQARISFTGLQSHEPYTYLYLISEREADKYLMSSYFPFMITTETINELFSLNLHQDCLPLLHSVVPIATYTKLTEYLQYLVRLTTTIDAGEIFSIILEADGHASAIVIHKDKKSMYHAYIQDSDLTAHDSDVLLAIQKDKERFHIIEKALYEILHIQQDHIHQFYIPEQQGYNFNCALWSLSNIAVINKNILKGASFNTMHTELSHDTPNIVQYIQQVILKHYDPPNLSWYRKQLMQSSEGANNHELKTNWLDDLELRNLIVHNPKCCNTFAIQWLHLDYNRSAKGFNIISKGMAWEALESELRQFVDITHSIQNGLMILAPGLVPTRTLIINYEHFYWVTLVIAYQNNKLYAYYVDSCGIQIPEDLRQILNNAKISEITDFNVLQQRGGHNGGIWAIENAIDINAIITQYHGSVNSERLIKHHIEEALAPSNNGRDHEEYFQNIRATLTKIPHNLQRFTALQEVVSNLGLCPSSDAALDRTKRAICEGDEEQQTDPISIEELQQTKSFESLIEIQQPAEDLKKVHAGLDLGLCLCQDLFECVII